MRRTLRGAIALVVLLSAGGAAGLWSTHAGPAPDTIASVTVSRQAFVRRVTAEGTLRAVTATEVVIPDVPGMWVPLKLAWLAPDGVVVQAGDVIARFDRSDAERQLVDARADLDAADVRLSEEQGRAAATIADRDASATLARRQAEQTRQFQPRDPMLASRNEIIGAELDERLATARQALAEHARQIDRRVSRTNVELLAIARRRAELTLGHATTALANMEIRAPEAGILVLRRDDHGDLPRLGAQLHTGGTIADIPVLDVMEAELFVLEVDGGGLEVNQPADLAIEARPERTLHGKVRLVDKLARPRQAWIPVQYVSVILALDQTERDVMKPGQRVRATLALDHRDALVVPRQAVFERAGQAIVYRRAAHGWAPVSVELGPATTARVVVTSGLAEGDVIALRDPTRSSEAANGSGAPSEPSREAP